MPTIFDMQTSNVPAIFRIDVRAFIIGALETSNLPKLKHTREFPRPNIRLFALRPMKFSSPCRRRHDVKIFASRTFHELAEIRETRLAVVIGVLRTRLQLFNSTHRINRCCCLFGRRCDEEFSVRHFGTTFRQPATAFAKERFLRGRSVRVFQAS